MAIPIKFFKSEHSIPWGFRLVGGQDFNEPIVVVKVNENSLAESFGLEVGDIIVRINDTSTAGLTHAEVHDLLNRASCEFELGIRRGEISAKFINNENYIIEEGNILMNMIEEDIFNKAVETVENMKNLLGGSVQTSIKEKSETTECQEIITTPTPLQSTCDVKKGQKWSTFLVKPDKPAPKQKRKLDEEKPKGDGYQVVIRKQSRRPIQETKELYNSENVIVSEVDLETELVADKGEAEDHEDTSESTSKLFQVEENKLVEVTEINNDGEDDPPTKEPNENDSEEKSADLTGPEKGSLEDLRSDKEMVEIPSSLEEQLLAVQKQLQALSELPSSIQMTLDAVSKQLATIVESRENKNSIHHQENTELEELRNTEGDLSSNSKEEEPETEEEFLDDTSTSEKAEAELLQEESEGNSSIAEELEEDISNQNELEKDSEENTKLADLTQEQIEAQIKKEHQLKQEKTMEQHSLRPVQRPIILPGGRKWSIPEDAIPSFRKPKMSDEKIIETIENNLEVIMGNRKGESNCWKVPSKITSIKNINFLKYQPPPKNLDYLQKSEVYRLVHDMEPPTKGITSRQEKILAVQDYYEATKEML